MIPQLRVRSEYSFRNAYGPVGRIADRLDAIGCEVAALVDTGGTWGHPQWEQELQARGIQPLFGVELVFERGNGKKPRAWMLALDTRQFYRVSSNPPTDPEELSALPGVVTFSGGCCEVEHFDYVDINPRSVRHARRQVQAARQANKPLVLTSDNDYPAPDDEARFLAWDDSRRMTPQHILADDELRQAFWFLDDATFQEALDNTRELGAGLQANCVELQRAPMIHFPGDLQHLVEEGRQYRLRAGHIPEWTEEYQQRLERELEMIRHKDYESYFLVVADLVQWAKTQMLVGPGRGSSAGSLVCYLLQITEVDPLVHGLIFERFIDVNRADLPDIDIDFNDQKRHLVFEYLAEKYGQNNVARIGNILRLKPRSVMAHVGKKMGVPRGATFAVLNVLIEYSSGDSRYGKGLEDTLSNTQPGRKFTEDYPEAQVMTDLEEHASHTGVHAAGIIVSNEPVNEFCTVRDGVAQVDKKGAEYLNLLKIDALGLRTLGVIEDAGCVEPQQLYGLSLDDPQVLDVFNERKFSGVFQFEGAAQRRVSIQIPVKSFQQIDHITALARPGPLGGGAANTYINRNAGREEVSYQHPTMESYLNDTMGVVLYQEQVMRIVRELGQFSWEETSTIRKAMSGRKGKEFFDQKGAMFRQGAAELGMGSDEAQNIWDEICTFGAWGMNKSHTVSYSIISYWCAYMKRYHPLEYAAACLRNAKDDEQVMEQLRELAAEGVSYVPFDPQLSEVNWAAKNGWLVGGFLNLVGIGPVKAQHYVQKRDAEGLGSEDLEKLAKHATKYGDLRPAHTMWGHLYTAPDEHNVRGPIKELAGLEDNENAVVICQMVRRERRDENETVRRERRGYALDGQTLFLDMFVVDDSVSKPVVMRIRPKMWERLGEPIADQAVDKQDWFLVRGRWLEQFSMMIVQKIKCLTNRSIV